MSPLRRLLQQESLNAIELHERIFAQGFAGTVRSLIQGLARIGVAVDRPEIRAFAGSAQTFDQGGSRDSLEFAQYIESFTARDAPPRGHVRVMTIHHSKGLGFDMVILPMLSGGSSIARASLSDGLLCQEGATPANIEWLLDAPGILAEHDPTLSAAAAGMAERECFEHLCVLYVAMTRARHGLYLLAPPPPAKATALHACDLVRAGLCPDNTGSDETVGEVRVRVLYRNGAPNWYDKVTGAKPPVAVVPARLRGNAAAVARHARVLPSREATHAEPHHAAGLFRQPQPGTLRGAEFGLALHALCAQLEWADAEPLDAVVCRWRGRTAAAPDLADAVEAHFRTALRQPEIAAALRRPRAADVTLWRERSFDVILDGDWVTGAFDRVAVTRNATGKADDIEVLDFKSDHVRSDADLARTAAGYRPQLELYRRALAQAFGIAGPRVRATLLFTGPGRRVPVE
jgi:ATP-dependent helicase/nuclease subunit A